MHITASANLLLSDLVKNFHFLLNHEVGVARLSALVERWEVQIDINAPSRWQKVSPQSSKPNKMFALLYQVLLFSGAVNAGCSATIRSLSGMQRLSSVTRRCSHIYRCGQRC